MNPRSGEAGSATLEALVLAPALIAVLALAIAAGRVGLARAAVEAAARDAARQASIARTPAQANTAALSSATSSLHEQGLGCTPQVRVEVAGLTRPVGTAATTSAEVSCQLALSDLGLPLPAAITLRARALSPVDPLRGDP
ncbi:TadE/TadG family type IV pilus assembly protein [Acrocarpospora sp. B8E8]|uniref:TadE/TadG family type IV pilus assembly protein n=1 Tax=Acrocarpospora sp. B8E8 TaxID=3153572 RepID=UPI00325E69AE